MILTELFSTLSRNALSKAGSCLFVLCDAEKRVTGCWNIPRAKQPHFAEIACFMALDVAFKDKVGSALLMEITLVHKSVASHAMSHAQYIEKIYEFRRQYLWITVVSGLDAITPGNTVSRITVFLRRQ